MRQLRMADTHMSAWHRAAFGLRIAILRVDTLGLLCALAVAGMAFDLPWLVRGVAVLLPMLLVLAFWPVPISRVTEPWSSPVPPGRQALLTRLEKDCRSPDTDSACLVLQIDGWDVHLDRFGGDACEEIAATAIARIQSTLRVQDLTAKLGDGRFGIVVHPLPVLRLNARDEIAARLQRALAAPISVQGTVLRLTACVGHSRMLHTDADPSHATLAAAELATSNALDLGPGTVVAFSPEVRRVRQTQHELSSEIEAALRKGEIRAWFQPQVRATSGVLSGFEALARWHHPERGILSPVAFLASVEEAGQMPALGATMLRQALDALASWDAAGFHIPSVSVNFSATELRNPTFADRIKWEIDARDFRPARLTVEILETVAADPDDIGITATLQALHRHGVGLDLDDFGIGQASLAAIRRYGVNRIKIDKSFITDIDASPEQRAMVAAVLSMADHLDVETLAEGVETETVHRLLAQMGCHHIQGYHISRPIPFEDTRHWIAAHMRTLSNADGDIRNTG